MSKMTSCISLRTSWTLATQPAQTAGTLACLLDRVVVFADSQTNQRAFVPGSVLSDEHTCRNAGAASTLQYAVKTSMAHAMCRSTECGLEHTVPRVVPAQEAEGGHLLSGKGRSRNWPVELCRQNLQLVAHPMSCASHLVGCMRSLLAVWHYHRMAPRGLHEGVSPIQQMGSISSFYDIGERVSQVLR